MTKQITITAYAYDELDEEAQKKAREWFAKDINCSASIKEHYHYTLDEMGYPTDDICFSLGYCQGDGMAFYGNINLRDFFAKRLICGTAVPEMALVEPIQKIIREQLDALGDAIDSYCGVITRRQSGYHYSHYNTMLFEIEDYCGCGSGEANIVLDELEEFIQNDIKNTSKILEKSGYAIIEDETSDDIVAENIRINEYLFTKHGSRSYVL